MASDTLRARCLGAAAMTVMGTIMGAGLVAAPAMAAENQPALLPWPASVTQGQGTLAITSGDTVSVPADDAGALAAAELLMDHARTLGAPVLTLGTQSSRIRFSRDTGISGEEAYRLNVTDKDVVIAASGDRGLLYGAMTLLQMIDGGRTGTGRASIAQLAIADAPRFAWRGVMIDTARHFQPIDSLYAILDRMVEVKLNTLHLHLTDDQGWRFEVKRYPELTRIGAWRNAPDTGKGPGERTGGFYTQDELRQLVAYAAARGITVVPEIDLPAHAQALVASYPQFGVLGDRPAVSNDWGVNPWLFNPAPEGIAFVRNVLDEIMEVFPSTYIHLGGDEAVKDQWQRSPQVQSQMRALGIKTENALQSWMIEQFGRYVAEHGRRLIGWDEILEGGLPPSASVMSWRGEQGAVDAANAGHDVVLSPDPNLYLNGVQSALGDEPPGRNTVLTLKDVYAYDPMPRGIDAEKAKHVMGVQGNVWTEYLVTPYQVQHMLFPRAGALAEIGWSQPSVKEAGYSAFVSRLAPQMQRWKQAGVEVADSAFAVAFTPSQSRTQALDAMRIGLSLATEAPYGTIRYTLDGKAPDAGSSPYRAPLSVKPGTIVTAASFAPNGAALSAARRFDTGRGALLTTQTAALTPCPGGKHSLRIPLNTEATANGPAYNVDFFETCQADDHAPLARAKAITVAVARPPRNFALAHEVWDEVRHYPVTTYGELVISAGCRAAADVKVKGAKQTQLAPIPGAVVLATIPLPDPATTAQQFTLSAKLPDRPELKDETDVCFQFTSPLSAPFYTVERVTYSENAR